MTAITRPLRPAQLIEPRSVAAGVLAAVALLGVYLGIISLAQGIEHALEQLGTDALFVGLIAAGFGTQIALFVELRAVDRLHRSAAAVTAAGTGTSAAAMLACCAHHLVGQRHQKLGPGIQRKHCQQRGKCSAVQSQFAWNPHGVRPPSSQNR